MVLRMRFLCILFLGHFFQHQRFCLALLQDVSLGKQNEQEGDPDDDIDPFEDDMEPIKYPAKSLMPKAAMDQSSPNKLTEEGSGTLKMDRDAKMVARVENLEQYLLLLTEKLNKQETTNKELLAAIAAQQQQRLHEKTALANTIGSLQGTILQLSGKVNEIPNELNRQDRKIQRQYLTSAINRVSNKLNQLGEKMGDTPNQSTSELRTRGTESTSELLGKLLGDEAEKALSLATELPGPKKQTSALSTPSGAGPVASASSSPVLQPAPQPSPQIGVTAPSTPTGAGPVGSAPAPVPAPVPAPAPAPAKPPATTGGYNVLPLVPVPQPEAQPPPGPQVPLDPPGIGSPQPVPTAIADELPAPGAVNPYEVLTSSQMQPKTMLGAPGAAGSQTQNPFEYLTSSQLPSVDLPMVMAARSRKFDRASEDADNVPNLKQQRHSKNRYRASQRAPQEIINEGSGVTAPAKVLSNRRRKVKLRIKNSNRLSKDPVYHDLVKALKIGSLRKVEQPVTDGKNQRVARLKESGRPVMKGLTGPNHDVQMGEVVFQTQNRTFMNNTSL